MLALFCKLKDGNYGRLLLVSLCFIALIPFVTHYHLTERSGAYGDSFAKPFHTRSTLQDSENQDYRLDELRKDINELEHVKLSLKNELRELEGKRHSLLRDIQEHSNNIASMKSKASNLMYEVNKRQQELEDVRFAKKMASICPQLPLMKPPKDILSKVSHSFKIYPKASFNERAHCKLSRCFDFLKCPFGHDFSAHIYKPYDSNVEKRVTTKIYDLLRSMPYAVKVSEPTACIYIVVIGADVGRSPEELGKFLHNLKFWQGDGHNHVIINFSSEILLESVDTGRAMVVQTSFGSVQPYRHGFDLLVPHLASLTISGDAWENSAPQLPANRRYLISFAGYCGTSCLKSDGFVSVRDLKHLSHEAKDIFIELSCEVDKEFVKYLDWQLCWSQKSRAEVLKESTFSLILQSEHTHGQIMSVIRLIEALQYGAIPVIISDNLLLPFSDIIEWHRASIILPSAQFPQMHYILRTILVNDILDIRRQGRFLWETYLFSLKTLLTSTIAAIQTRLSLPSVPIKDIHFPSVFPDGVVPLLSNLENKAVIQPPVKSPSFYRNFTATSVYARQRWNKYPGGLVLFPSSPFLPVLPSSAAFLNSSFHMQPLGNGAGGAGVEFQKALGGDHPFEQFTVVMLTYEREMVLIEALARLTGLKYLNKVIVVWNSAGKPSPDLKWPDIGVPLKVLRAQKNSLNNRFLPFDEIETDAILSMDDDIHLRHDEILFAFRVWREARDRIVGFPGRFHAWDLNYGSWLYNSNYSCELSMILTGAAFIHKYYNYVYTHVMSQAIRDKVDEYTNCEDIAMNFLVSHITRKPPIKVTSRWTFRCPGCSQALYLDKTHFNERHKCINFFVKVFGYMPLLRTQFRADSVLFKTRIPHTKTKCFTYI